MSARLFTTAVCLVSLSCAASVDDPIDGRARGAPLDAAARARSLVLDQARQSGVSLAPDDLALADLSVDGGTTRVRFRLAPGGVRVDGGDVVVVLDAQGAPRSVSPLVASPGDLRPPRVDAAAASSAAVAAVAAGRDAAGLRLEQPAELVALPFDAGLATAWRVVIGGELDGSWVRREVFVDAGDCTALRQREGLRAATASGSGLGVFGERRALAITRDDQGFALHDATRGARGIRTYSARGRWRLPGVLVRSDDAHAWDEDVFGAGAAVDGHANAARVSDFLAEALGRDSWDGEGGRIAVVVHFGDAVDNAFWDGRRAVFGDGDGERSVPFSAALDVVAHEIFHGVIDAEAGLVYEEQPGAIAESYADVFGSLVEQHAGPGDWIVGGEVVQPPLRDLARPALSGAPSHMREYVELRPVPEEDMGGVHVNSTIPSRAAVLVADGGVHELSGVRVPAAGRVAMRRIWWRALTTYLAPRARFRDLARATRSAAEDLYGEGSREAESTRLAWAAVGVR